MDLIALDEHLKKHNPEKKIEYSFPLETIRFLEIVLSEGKANPEHHIETRHVLVNVEGKEPWIEPLTSPHRLTVTHEHMKTIIKEIFP